MDEGMHTPFPKNGWPRISQELPMYNTYMPKYTMPCYATAEKTRLTTVLGRTKMASGEVDPRPHKYSLSVEFLKACGQKTYRRHIICRLYQVPWFHSQREDGANFTRIRPTKKKPSQP